MAAASFPRHLVIILGSLAALGAAAIDMYLPGLPVIERDLTAAPGQATLTLSAFFVGLAIGQLFYGPTSDAWGRRRIMACGVMLYCVASLACMFAATIEQLVAARCLQALGAASGTVIARAMVRDMFEGDLAARAQSFINLAFSITPLLAPTIGGYVLIWFGWRAIFLVLSLFGLACLVALVLRVPETLADERRTPLSPRGLVRSYRRILSERQTVSCMLTSSFAFACMFVFFALSPFVYTGYFGVPNQHYGLLFAVNVVGIMIGNAINARLVTRFGTIAMLRAGSLVSAAGGLLLLVTTSFELGGLVGVVLPMTLVVGSLGIIGANAIAGAMAPVPTLAATAASLLGFVQMMIGAAMGMVAGLMDDGTPLPLGQLVCALSLIGLAFAFTSRQPAR